MTSSEVRPARLTPSELVAQRAITAAMQTADANRMDGRRYFACLGYAARTIDTVRIDLDTVDRNTDRAWRD